MRGQRGTTTVRGSRRTAHVARPRVRAAHRAPAARGCLFVAALCVIAVAALAALAALPVAPAGAKPAAQRAARLDAQSAPLVLRQAIGLSAQFGYSPAYVRNVPSFDSQDRPYFRSRGADLHRTGFVQTLTTPPAGTPYWQSFSFLAALRAVYPSYASVYYGAGWWSDRVVFDISDRAYTVVSVQMPDQSIKNALLASTDLGRSWRGVALPDGEIASEHFTGHNRTNGPPFIGVFVKSGYLKTRQANIFTLQVTQPRWAGGTLVVPPAVTVSTSTFGWSQHSGGAGFSSTRYSPVSGRFLTHFVWGEVTTDKSLPGSPMYASTYDPVTGQVTPKVLLGHGTPVNDVHCTPGIVTDGNGYLHVLFGSHHQSFQYTCSMMPDGTWGGWTAQVDVLDSGYVTDPLADPDGEGEQTYVALVCGPDGTLHLAFRQYRKGLDPYFGGKACMSLSYMRKPPGPAGQPWASAWETPQVLAVPAAAGYAIWFQKLAIDNDGRLYLSASNLTGADKARLRGRVRVWRLRGRVGPRPGYYLRRFVLTSTDGGWSWRLATQADFEAGQGVGGAPAAAAAALLPTPGGFAGRDAPGAAVRAPTLLSTGTAGWQWRNRLPQGNALGGVDFVDKKHGVAVGDAGTILLTRDGGASWHSKVVGTRAALFGVDLVDRKKGWAVGDVDPRTGAGTILRTANGGVSWARQKSPVSVPLFGCVFADARRGWAVGDRGTILATTNGGASWKRQASHTTNTLYAVTALDARNAWAVGENGVVLRTVDAGRHWQILRPTGQQQQQPVEEMRRRPGTGSHRPLRVADRYATAARGPAARAFDFGELYAVAFKSRTLGWAVGEGGGVFISRNGGKTWTRQKVATRVHLTGVRLVTLRSGWISGHDGTLLYTTDQGRRWKRVKTPKLSLYAMSRLDADTGWAVGEDGQMLRLKRPKQAPVRAAKGFSTDLFGASFSGATGLVVGAGGTVLRTANAGASWAWQKPVVKTALRAVDIAGSRAVAVGDQGSVLTSSKGGQSWTARAAPLPADLRGVDLSGDAGWAVGAGGTVLRTTDAGASWQAQAAGTSEDLNAVLALSGTQAWAGGGDTWGDQTAVLLCTADAGASWVPVPLIGPTGAVVRGDVGALCTAGGQIWAAGSDWAPDDDAPTGFVARSGDAGATWQVVYLAGTSRIRALTCSAPGVLWAVGEDGAAFRSADGGATWADVRTGAGQHLRAVVFTSQARGWLFGAGGAMLATKTGGVRGAR